MKTQALIELLAHNAGPAPQHLDWQRLAPATAFGVAASATLTLAWLGLVPSEMFAGVAPWSKLAYATLLIASAGLLASRLGRPAAPVGHAWGRAWAVVGAMAVVGLAAWWVTPAPERLSALLGHSWAKCPWAVLGLSLPALAATLWAMRGLAPTRPRRAGFAAGLLAGAAGAAGYSLGCTEESLAFVAIWYTAGVALTAGLGALVGPRLLRW
jgi:hypothetical protein